MNPFSEPHAVYTRGNPDRDIIHRRKPQHRPGMVEGGADYSTAMICGNGAWHCRFTNDPKKVTCPACLAAQEAAV